jgi:hypothetical protein
MARVQEHLEVCAFCAAEFAFEADVLERVRVTLRRIDAPSDLVARVRRSLERASEASPAPGADRVETGPREGTDAGTDAAASEPGRSRPRRKP